MRRNYRGRVDETKDEDKEGVMVKRVYVNSRLHTMAVDGSLPEKKWIWSQGERWLLLTNSSLKCLAARLGDDDSRIIALAKAMADKDKPAESNLAYAFDDSGIVWMNDVESEPLPLVAEDKRIDREVRQRLLAKHPYCQKDFKDGVLHPNWRINEKRRLDRDWDKAIGMILMGRPYREVAKEFCCSVGTIYRKAHMHRESMA